MHQQRHRLAKGLLSGLVAITINTFFLKASSLFGITAEGGGLLKLLLVQTRDFLCPGLLSFFKTSGFWFLFHYATGLVMVFLYVFFIAPILPGSGLLKGSLFSLLPWVINGFLVLPLLGQGVLGIYQLSATGILYFFIANWLFGALLGLLYENGKKPETGNLI